MRSKLHQTAAWSVLYSLVLWALAMPVSAGPAAGRLEGLLLDVQGQPARGHEVVLVDSAGAEVGIAETSGSGLYSFAGLAPGEYGLGIRGPEGAAAPVAAPAVRMKAGELARRDIRLEHVTAEQLEASATADYGLRLWWVSRSKKEKAAWAGGLVAGSLLAWFYFEDDDERISSPILPGS